MQEIWVRSLSQEDPLEEGMDTLSIFMPGEFHRQRNLLGHSPWGRKESDTTEQLILVSKTIATVKISGNQQNPYICSMTYICKKIQDK